MEFLLKELRQREETGGYHAEHPGVLQCQMDTGVTLTLPNAGAFGENTISKNEESLGEKPDFGSKLAWHWVRIILLIFQ